MAALALIGARFVGKLAGVLIFAKPSGLNWKQGAALGVAMTPMSALAYLLARRKFAGKGLVAGFLILPLVLPPTVLGYYLLVLLGRALMPWTRQRRSRGRAVAAPACGCTCR